MKTKEEIREVMRRHRRALTNDERTSASLEICSKILECDNVRAQIRNHRPFAVYLASEEELNLTSLIDFLWAADVPVAVPCWNAEEKCYRLGAYDKMTALTEGRHHIFEPAEVKPVNESDIGVWIVPGLAFTRDGCRIGYGGGWYDRLLARSTPSAITLGVAYSFQMIDNIPKEFHDQVLSAVICTKE